VRGGLDEANFSACLVAQAHSRPGHGLQTLQNDYFS